MAPPSVEDISLGEVYRGLIRVERALAEVSDRLTATHTNILDKVEHLDQRVGRLEERQNVQQALISSNAKTRERRSSRWLYGFAAIASASGWATVFTTLMTGHR